MKLKHNNNDDGIDASEFVVNMLLLLLLLFFLPLFLHYALQATLDGANLRFVTTTSLKPSSSLTFCLALCIFLTASAFRFTPPWKYHYHNHKQG